MIFKLVMNENAKFETYNFRNINSIIFWLFAKFMRFSINLGFTLVLLLMLKCVNDLIILAF